MFNVMVVCECSVSVNHSIESQKQNAVPLAPLVVKVLTFDYVACNLMLVS